MKAFNTNPYFKQCSCVRPGELSGGVPDEEERAGYVQLRDGSSWARRTCGGCLGLGTIVLPRQEQDYRCVCVRQKLEVPADDRASYVEVPKSNGEWARQDCLCKGTGFDLRLAMLWDLEDMSRSLLNSLTSREGDLERYILRLKAQLDGRPEPPLGAEYVQGIDGP